MFPNPTGWFEDSCFYHLQVRRRVCIQDDFQKYLVIKSIRRSQIKPGERLWVKARQRHSPTILPLGPTLTRASPRLKGPSGVIWIRHKRLRQPRCYLLCLLGSSRRAFAHPCQAPLDVKDRILQPTLKDKCCVLARNIGPECTSPETNENRNFSEAK